MSAPQSGKVYLIGAGPGAADLLTLRALRALREAEILLVDDLLPEDFFDDAGQFAKSRDSAIRNVGHMRNTTKRQQMVLAHTGERDVANKHNFVVAFFERYFEVTSGILLQARKHFRIHLCDSTWSFEQSFTVRVFPDSS